MTTVREGGPPDLPRLRAIQQAVLSDPWPEMLETAAADGPPLLLVVEDDDPVGYAIALEDGEMAYLPEVAVAQDRQGEGLGSTLLEAVLERLSAAGHESARLTVRADDERARSFYADHGFDPVDRVPDHYQSGADGLVLARDL